MKVTLEDLGLAYRKAKVDLYYTSHPSLAMIAEYEADLNSNLRDLHARLDGDDEKWARSKAFLGGWTLAAKGLTCVDGNGVHERFPFAGKGDLIYSSPHDEWESACANLDSNKKLLAEFRLMAQPSMDFHVLSALWIMKIGHHYDKSLGKCAYGSRLRRTECGEFNPLSLGSFKPYLKPFRDWRDSGIRAMRSALEAKKRVLAITADVRSFYHELSPVFMLDPSFHNEVDLPQDLHQNRLHQLFVDALMAWAKNTPLKKGLPVGLPASAVVANMALIGLDRLIEREAAPLYYGRYVDDIILVMEDGGDFGSTSDVWEWLLARVGPSLDWADAGKDKSRIRFQPDYLRGSNIQFDNGKNKMFRLDGLTGLAMVDSIERQIHERASEWRALPTLPRSAEQIGTDLITATQQDGQIVDNLRKADSLAMKRAGFAIKLRDFEAYERDLPPGDWEDHRHAFFDAFIRHVLVMPHFFELENYLSRVVRLAVACEDFEHLGRIIKALGKIVDCVSEHCEPRVKAAPEKIKESNDELIEKWRKMLRRSVHQGVVSALPPSLSKAGKASWKKHIVEQGHEIGSLPLNDLHSVHAHWFACDLAHLPLRFAGLPNGMVDQRGIPKRSRFLPKIADDPALPDPIPQGIRSLATWIRFSKSIPTGLWFSTRPFNLSEVFVIAPHAFEERGRHAVESVIVALRGFSLNEKAPVWSANGDVLQIADGPVSTRQTLAVSCWRTEQKSWLAAAAGKGDPVGRDRYERLTRLLNGVISDPNGASYLVLPESSVPARWFMRFAYKLQARKISLIAGIEYLHVGRGRVRNQVWAALSHDGLGFPSILVYRQDKQRPALHEERELQRVAGLEMTPGAAWKTPPIIQHGEFRFALLVCSELTNIGYRAALRGKIDALFVPEWNPDTETFNALVESAALDVHAYVIQCNDRQYGDSRIRAPFKDAWRRDVLRVKGGISDYCVIGEIDVQILRRFQSSFRSPPGPFKPVPDGFKICHARLDLPLPDSD